MSYPLIFLFIITFLLGCHNTKEKQPERIPAKHNSSKNIFLYEDNHQKQSLSIKYIEKDKISFRYEFYNHQNGQKILQKGIAINHNINSDPEIDVDEEGIAYPCNEYVFEQNSQIIVIRIDMLEKNKARINFSGFDRNNYPESSELLNLIK